MNSVPFFISLSGFGKQSGKQCLIFATLDGLISRMNAVISKPGRKPKHYISSDGTQIKGLAKDIKSGR